MNRLFAMFSVRLLPYCEPLLAAILAQLDQSYT